MGHAVPTWQNEETAILLKLARSRRTYYGLKPESPIPDSAIETIVQDAVLHVPSSFNTQTSRIVLLLKEEHEKLWQIAINIMEKFVAAGKISKEMFEHHTLPKLRGFQAGYGTVLFFVDYESLDSIKAKLPRYAEKFDPYALESNAMSQYLVWLALEAEGFGANLQHYSPLIDSHVQEQWNLPTSWKLDAQLVFGTPTGEPGEKTFLPLEGRFKVFGK